MNEPLVPGFTNKEVLLEIKRELADFRSKYDTDQQRRDSELSKRPTRAELYALVGVVGVIIGAVFGLMRGAGV